jgi:putative ABC transport system permease protein
MPLIGRIVLWARALFRRARVETEMDKEMRLHLEMEIEHNIGQGMAPDDAKRAALIAFGGVEAAKDAVRDERGTQWLEHTATDVRFALRGFRNHPLFAVGVIAIIALGIGPNTAIFSVIDNVLISPFPYPDGNRMVELVVTTNHGGFYVGATTQQLDAWRARARAVQDITLVASGAAEIGDASTGPTESVQSTTLTPGAMAFTSARPVLGRDVAPSDTMSSSEPVALIGYATWQRAYGGRNDAIGRAIIINNLRHTIVGVVPDGFTIPFSSAAQIFPAYRSSGGPRSVGAIAKLRPGAMIGDANREIASIFAQVPTTQTQDPPRLQRAIDSASRDTKRVIYLMFGAVMVVMLIACANVANLMLARAWGRQREFAVRAAMGAGRGRLIRQMLTESATLSISGAIVGIGVAKAMLSLLVSQSQMSDFRGARLEPIVLLWAIGLTILAALAFGFAPALFAAGNRTSDALKAGARSASASVGSRRVRSILVIAEVALSAMLLVVSGLLIRTIVAARQVDVGVDTRGLWGMRLGFAAQAMPDSIGRAAAFDALLARVRAIPGVSDATLAISLPPHFAYGVGTLQIEGRTASPNDSIGYTSAMATRPEYFRMMHTRLIQGRIFAPNHVVSDRGDISEIVINQSFARRVWPSGDAIGSRLKLDTSSPNWSRIVGIVQDVTIPMSTRPGSDIQIYDAGPRAPKFATLVLRTSIPMATILPAVEAAIHDVSARFRFQPPGTADDLLAQSRAMHRYLLTMLGTFSALALLLAAFGVHAVIAYSVSQRTREIGVRVALGADATHVMQLVFGQGARLVGAGIFIGVIGGGLAGGAMRALLYQVTARDPVTLAAVTGLLALVALTSCYAPARRAMLVDPVEALRAD